MIATAIQAPTHRPRAAHAANRSGAETSAWNFGNLESLRARRSAFSDGHRRLCLALLEGVFRDVIQHRDYGFVVPMGVTGRLHRMADARAALSRELHDWLADEAPDHPLSLVNVCEVLALDPAALRDGLRKILAAAQQPRAPRGSGPIRRGRS